MDVPAESHAPLDGGGWWVNGTDPVLGRLGWCEAQRAVRPLQLRPPEPDRQRHTAGVGDTVRIVETRPLSKQKRWRLAEIVEKAK